MHHRLVIRRSPVSPLYTCNTSHSYFRFRLCVPMHCYPSSPPKMTLSQPRLPLPPTNLQHYPADYLSRISRLTGCASSSLSTLTISSNIDRLYGGILRYAALSTPNLLHAPFPLMVDAMARWSELEEDLLLPPPPLKKETAKKPDPPIPKFKLAIGETQVKWPPPSHLSAEYFAAERARRRRRKLYPDLKDEVVEIEKKEGGDTIYIAHYEVGEVQTVYGDELEAYREILLVSTGGIEILKAFVNGIIRWRIDKNNAAYDGHAFSLFRYKVHSRGGGRWRYEGERAARSPGTVVLEEGMMEKILEDVRKFVSKRTAKWYKKFGLPYKRTLLFYGEPGTGKTSTIRVLASVFGMSCCYLNVTNGGFSNQRLMDALADLPKNALVVMEDLESWFEEGETELTFSGVLNVLDGVQTTEGVVMVLTTNAVQELDQALIRPGRVDRRFKFGEPRRKQLETLFRNYYPAANQDLVARFAKEVLTRREGAEAKAMSTLQQLFIEHRESSAEDCVRGMPTFFEQYFQGDRDDGRKFYV